MSCSCRTGPAAAAEGDDGCSGGESFALRVLGEDMAPEFHHGDIVIVEPDGALHDGSFVLAQTAAGWLLRQLVGQPGGWSLRVLDGSAPDEPLPDLAAVHGVIIQKAVPGRRRLTRLYV